MRFVLGFPGSGTKWVAHIVAAAAGGVMREEPWAGLVQAGDVKPWFFSPFREENRASATQEIQRYWEGHSHCTAVVKEEFGTPYWIQCAPGPRVYILRDTLANVEFLLRWPPLHKGWYDRFWARIVANNQAMKLALWPDGVPYENVECMLAVAHKIQTSYDLQAAKDAGVKVFRYEDLCADYVVTWPRLLWYMDLSVSNHLAQMIQGKAPPEVSPLLENRKLVEWVNEIEEKAALWNSSLVTPS